MIRFLNSNVRAGFGLWALCLSLLLLGGVPALADVHLTDVDPLTGDPVGVADQFLGGSVAFLPDINGDGLDELIVGVPGDTRAGTNTGAVFFWYGGHARAAAPDRIWTGLTEERLGTVVAAIGDVNRGGKADFALGAPWYSGKRGRVFVIYGENLPASGSASALAPLEILGENGGDQFGFSVAAAGNFNGDNSDDADLIVGAPYSFGSRGSAYVLFGGSGGPSADLADATSLAGQFGGNRFGWSVSGAGNFLGGNEEAVAVGAPFYTLYGLNAGAVFVYEGTLAGAAPDTTIEKILRPDITNRAGTLYGYVVRGGARWDNDSYADVAVGGPGANDGSGVRGRVEVHLGDPSVSGLGDSWLEGVAANDSLGYSIGWVHEPGSDRPDLLVGAPYANAQDDQGNGTSDGGRAYRWANGASSGGAAGAGQLPVTPQVPGTAGGDHYGAWVASAGDFNGDGMADLAVGAPTGNIANNAVAGYVHLMDSDDLVVPNLVASWQADWSAGGAARLVFALSVSRYEVAGVDLVRRDGAGRHTLWSGPALAREGGLQDLGGSYLLVDRAAAGGSRYDMTVHLRDGGSASVTGLAGPSGNAPSMAGLEVAAPWPNPANPMVTVRFRAESGRRVAVTVHDLRGRVVRRLPLLAATGAWQETVWDGQDHSGAAAASGVYLLRVDSGDAVRRARVTLAR